METSAAPTIQPMEIPKVAKATKITKLVLNGFKSFGKYTEMLFGDDFNVILGPNGSGKSNVLDALCFVLGKSSSKQLRAEKSANLIYNGGKTKNPAKEAEVSIVFDNKAKVFPMEEDEIKLTRIVRADGAGKYKINGKTKTRQEILELLGSAKINPDGYNIILQGDITRLVMMSGIELRQLVEEIAGIGVYEEKKQQALNELEKVGAKLNEAEIILKERETYLKELKKDRDQALKYKELNDQIKQNKASYLKRQLNKKDGELKKLEDKSSGHKEKLTKYQQQIQGLREEIASHRKTIQDINSEIERKGEIEQIKIQKEVEQMKIQLAMHKQRISTCKTEIERIGQRKEQLQKNLEEVDGKMKELNEQKNNQTAQVQAMAKTITELDVRIKEFKAKHDLADDADIDKQFADLDKKAEDKQREIQILREKQQALVREKDKAEFQIATMDEKIAKVKELESAHTEELKMLKNQKEQFKKMVLELNELLNQDSKDANTLAKGRADLHSMREDESKLSIKQASVQESIAANIAVKKVLENRQKFGEVYGTVSELGSSDSKYALALEIAASQKIHSIVVDEDKTAAQAIKFLKMGKFGFATFLPLNKIKPTPAKEELKKLAKEKGVHGFAIDLLDFDPKFKNVFSHVFGNTLVVEDIETARRIGIGEARMVTLDGDICEHSGAMTGGFRAKKSGSFKEKEIEGKLEDTRKQVIALEDRLHTLEQNRKSNEDKITKLRELKANLEGDIIKQEKSLHLDTGDLESTKNYKEELTKTIKQIGKDLEALEENIAIETKALTDVKIEKQTIRNKITELRNPRVLAELNAFEEKRKQLEQEKVRIEGEQKGIDVQLTDILGRDKENMGKLLKDMEKEEEAFTGEITDLDKMVGGQQTELDKKEKEQAQFFSQFKGLIEKRNKLDKEVTDKEGRILNIDEVGRKEEMTLNLLSIEEAKVKAETAGLNAEFEQYSGIELNMEKPEEQLKKEISEFEKMMITIGNVNMRALEIYETVEKEYGGLLDKKNVLLKEKDSVVGMMNEIEKNKKDLFLNTLTVVDGQFRRIFSQLTTKGEAYLEVENKEDPFAGGLKFNVRLSGNKFIDIRSLSGGEKTLTGLAFLFAIQEHEPATFYILDEVDAALDKQNSEKLAKLIRSYCNKAQYVVISHNDAIISEGDILYGVSMNQEAGLSNVVSLKM